MKSAGFKSMFTCVFLPYYSLLSPYSTHKHTYSRGNLCSLVNANNMSCYTAFTTDVIIAVWWDLYLLGIRHTPNFLRDSLPALQCTQAHTLYLAVYSLYFSFISYNFELVTSPIYMYIYLYIYVYIDTHISLRPVPSGMVWNDFFQPKKRHTILNGIYCAWVFVCSTELDSQCKPTVLFVCLVVEEVLFSVLVYYPPLHFCLPACFCTPCTLSVQSGLPPTVIHSCSASSLKFTWSLSACQYTVYLLHSDLRSLWNHHSVHRVVSEKVFELIVILPICPL